MSLEATRRVAHVWTIEQGIVRVPVDDFPRAIMLGAFVYEANVTVKGEPLVRCGQRTRVEFVEYRRRRPIQAGDFPMIDALCVVNVEALHGE